MSSSEWTQERLEQVRQTALTLAERAKTNEEFRAKIQQHPVETLTEAGLPREAVGNFLRDTQIVEDASANDVSGYDTICIGSICP